MGGVSMKTRVSLDGASSSPPDGWIRTTRQAGGVSLRQLGARLGIRGNSVHVAERREVEGGISIYQLRRMAQALDCELFYAFVPKTGAAARPSQRYADGLKAREQDVE
jgi:predicted DNA-binding mobile mystery protein A